MRDRPRLRSRRAGFTIVELMVALVIGAIVVAAVYTLGGRSARHFQEQQRVGTTQRSVRFAMDRLRRDIDRAGYGSVPDTRSPRVRMCPSPAVPRIVQAVAFTNDDVTGNQNLDGINRAANRTSADRLLLTGNFGSDESYLVRSFDSAGSQITLQTDWLGFRRSFITQNGATAIVSAARYTQVFSVGRMLHIETANGFHLLTHITASSLNAAGSTPTITISPGIGVDNVCLRGFGRGAIVTPVSQVQYFVTTATAGSNLTPQAVAVTGPNTQLIRDELSLVNNNMLAGTRRAVLDYVVDFNLDFIVDQANPPNPPALVRLNGAAAQATLQNQSWQVRSVIVSLAARTAEQDTRFPWPAAWGAVRPSDQPLSRYRVFPARPGAARVRQLETEVQLPNLIPR